jgi:hypothetical protein
MAEMIEGVAMGAGLDGFMAEAGGTGDTVVTGSLGMSQSSD